MSLNAKLKNTEDTQYITIDDKYISYIYVKCFYTNKNENLNFWTYRVDSTAFTTALTGHIPRSTRPAIGRQK